MILKKKYSVLYISYDGILENIGQSQILPLLKKISKNWNLILMTFEKKKDLNNIKKKHILDEINKHKIKSIFNIYSDYIYYFSSILNFIKGNIKLIKILLFTNIKIVHLRSLMPALIILPYIYIFNFKIIFDIRGFWIDEKVERRGLNKKSFTYFFFKKIEKIFIYKSDTIVCLTNESKKIIKKIYNLKDKTIVVIPTCVDQNLFYPKKIKKNNDIINLGYIGTTSGAYNFNLVVQTFKKLLNINEKYKLTVISNDTYDDIKKIFLRNNVDTKFFSILNIEHKKINSEINKLDLGIFYLNNNFSIKASFPTKIAEFLACGVPIICNNFNEDVFNILLSNKFGYIHDFKTNNIIKLNNQINKLKNNNIKKYSLNYVKKNLSLDFSSISYDNIYKNLI